MYFCCLKLQLSLMIVRAAQNHIELLTAKITTLYNIPSFSFTFGVR